MFTLTFFTIAAAAIGFFGGTIALATAVSGVIFAKLFPMVTVFIVVTAVGLAVLRYRVSK